MINIWIDLNPELLPTMILQTKDKRKYAMLLFQGPIMRVGPIRGLVFNEGIAFCALAVALRSSPA